ncbi:hypothetical protein GCM10010954_11040 [Halobacillus andaensis]|uniref:Uncharacterized protein n=1 Tax=Halobacillus andaensis TaxID=1176239 RepID=A0A917B172_HALAA|nr:hypothetical protein GCM10010954_11040 [Halobacillus andaensis]
MIALTFVPFKNANPSKKVCKYSINFVYSSYHIKKYMKNIYKIYFLYIKSINKGKGFDVGLKTIALLQNGSGGAASN